MNLRTIITSTALAAGLAAGAQAQSSVDYTNTGTAATTRVRPNLFYQLPGGAKAYSFIELYGPQGNGENGTYFGKNIMSRPLVGPISLAGETVHGSGFSDYARVGVKAALPVPNGYLSVTVLPLRFNGELTRKRRDFAVGYSGAQNLGKYAHIEGFAQLNASTQQWGYGETNALVNVGKIVQDVAGSNILSGFAVGGGVDMINNEGLMPKTRPAAVIRYTPANRK